MVLLLLNWHVEENLVMNNKGNRVIMSRNYRSDSCPWKVDVLKSSIFSLKASFSGQMFVLRTSNVRPRGNYQPIVPRQRHSDV